MLKSGWGNWNDGVCGAPRGVGRGIRLSARLDLLKMGLVWLHTRGLVYARIPMGVIISRRDEGTFSPACGSGFRPEVILHLFHRGESHRAVI